MRDFYITMTTGTWNRMSPVEQTDMANLLLRLLLLLPIIAGASATCSNTYEVGGPGHLWSLPPDLNFFITWAASITFYPGDCLQFNRIATASVYQLSESDYQTCSLSNPLKSWPGIGYEQQIVDPFPDQSSYPVSFYFSSSLYCSAGMKFAATVSDPSSAPPSPGGTNSTSKSPPGTPATKPGSTIPSSTLAGSAPSSAPLSTGSIAGIVVAAVVALTGGAGMAYKLNNYFTCCVFNHNSSATNQTAANGGGDASVNGGGNGVGNRAGSGVRNGVGIPAGNGAGYGVRNGPGYGGRHGVGHATGNGAGYGFRNVAGYGVQNGFVDGVGSESWDYT